MFYTIDFDTLKVESKSLDGEDLAEYLFDNDLSLAIAVVGSADDIELNLSLDEMNGLHTNLINLDEFEDAKPASDFTDETEAAEACWNTLEQFQAEFPKFTKALGNKLLKGAVSKAKDSPEPVKADKPAKAKAAKAPAKTNTSNAAKTKDLIGKSFVKGAKEPRQGTSFVIFTEFLDENMGEATFDELVAAFVAAYVPRDPKKPVDESLGKAYVRDAFNGGYIEEAL